MILKVDVGRISEYREPTGEVQRGGAVILRVIEHDVVLSTIHVEGKEREGGVHWQEQIHDAGLRGFRRDGELGLIESERCPKREAILYEEALAILDVVMVQVGLTIHKIECVICFRGSSVEGKGDPLFVDICAKVVDSVMSRVVEVERHKEVEEVDECKDSDNLHFAL